MLQQEGPKQGHEIASQVATRRRAQKKIGFVFREHSEEELERVCGLGGFPIRPSSLFLKIYSDILITLEKNPRASVAYADYTATHGTIPLTINAPPETVFRYYRDIIVEAESEVLIAAGFWKPSACVDIIIGALRELNERIARSGESRKVVVKIIWGRGYLRYRRKVDRNKLQKLNILSSLEAPFLDIEVMNAHKLLFGVFHVKFMVVDHKYLLLTSANIQPKPENIEFMTHMEGGIVDSFYSTFTHMWNKVFSPPLPLAHVRASNPALSSAASTQQAHSRENMHAPCIFHSAHTAVPMLIAHRHPHGNISRNWVTPQNVAWLSIMYNAQRNIFIETPDFNEALAVKSVIAACSRGVHVTIVISWVYNAWKERIGQGGTNQHVLKGLYKKLEKRGIPLTALTICFYVATDQTNVTKMHANHTKFLCADDEVAIFGSGNMDTQSWQHSQEVNVVVDSPQLIREWLDLFKISQNTHLYGVVDPTLPTHPLAQMEAMLAKQNTVVTVHPPDFQQQQLLINKL